MDGATRYAIYFAPPPDSRWWRFGCQWLGRDPIEGCALQQFEVPHVTAAELRELTGAPRGYGFHATLKPPFALAAGATPGDLYQSAAAFARTQQPFALGQLILRSIGDFLAVVPAQEPPELRALARTCVERFDALRCAPREQEVARRRAAGLTPRQEELLVRWGYPYVMDEWRFHMTLTRGLTEAERLKLSPRLVSRVHQLNADPLAIDAICLFAQPARDMPFMLTHRFGFDGEVSLYRQAASRGRLFYVVGASGAGKDSLLAYAKERLAGGPIAFAHRYITRAPDAGSENHVALGEAEFEARACRGAFAMHWTSNGHRYGIGSEIDHWLAKGLDVVANGSRAYLDVARSRYPDMTVVWVSASPATLAARLAARGREDALAIKSRLARAERYAPPPGAIIVDNDGALDEAGDRLVRIIRTVESAAPAALEVAC